jgi:hypothetical protein
VLAVLAVVVIDVPRTSGAKVVFDKLTLARPAIHIDTIAMAARKSTVIMMPPRVSIINKECCKGAIDWYAIGIFVARRERIQHN